MPITPEEQRALDDRYELMAERVIERVLKAHIEICPHGKMLFGSKMLIAGIAIGSVILGTGSGAVIATVAVKALQSGLLK